MKKLNHLLALIAIFIICCTFVGCGDNPVLTDDSVISGPVDEKPNPQDKPEDQPQDQPENQPHEHNLVYHSTVEPSCQREGYTYYSCTGCDYGEVRDVVEIQDHSFSEYLTRNEPTFFNTGLRYRTCGGCELEETEIIPKLTVTLTYSIEDGLHTLTVDHGCDTAFDWRILELDPTRNPNVTVLGEAIDFDRIEVLEFGEGVTEIYEANCNVSGESLVKIIFSTDIRYIGNYALKPFGAVEKIYFMGNAPELGYEPFTKNSGDPAVIIPTEAALGFAGIVFGDLKIARPWIEHPEVDLSGMTLGEYAELAAVEAAELAETVLNMFTDNEQLAFALLPYEEDIEKYKLIREFTLELTQNCTTDREKVDTIYDWLVGNVIYDANAMRYEPYQVLSTRRAVCAGYVTLMHDMLAAVDIVSFYTRGSTLFGNMATTNDVFLNRDSFSSHAWLTICLADGDISFCDPTWGVMSQEDYRNMSAEELGNHAVTFEVDGLEVMVPGADYTMFKSEGLRIRFIYEDGYIYAADQGEICTEEASIDYFNYWFSEAYLINSPSSNYRPYTNQPIYSAHTEGIVTSDNLMCQPAFARADGRIFTIKRILDFIKFRNEILGDAIKLESVHVVQTDDMLFNIHDSQLGLIYYYGTEANITVPSTVDGMPVTEISQFAFASNPYIERVIIENGITKMWVGAFYNNPNLKYVYLPASLCYATNDRVLPDDRFGRCSITFERCPMIEAIEVDPANAELVSISGNLYSKDKAELIYVAPKGCSGVFILPESVEYISNNAFAYAQIESIVFHQGPIYVGEFAFMYSDITNLTIPAGVKIGRYAFAYADRLHSVVLEMGHTTVAYSAFANCNSLINVTLPSSIRTIEEFAFNLCTRLYTITLPEGLVTVEPYAFVDTPLVSVTLPSTLQTIGEDAFLGCNRLYVVNNLSPLPLFQGGESYGRVAYSAMEINSGFVDNSNIYLTENGLVFYNNGSINVLVEYVALGAKTLILPDKFMEMDYVLIDRGFADFDVSGWDVMDMFDINYWDADVTHSGDDVTTIYIPATIINIPQYAFAGWGALEYVYYGGTAEQWQTTINIDLAQFNPEIAAATIAFFSADEPTDATDGTVFWHYVDNTPTLW